MSAEIIIDIILDAFKDTIENLTMPTGKNLMPSFFISIGITVLSFGAKAFGLFPLFDWRGALIATFALGILVFIERRGIDEVSRLYRAAKVGAGALAQRAKGANSGGQADGSDDTGDVLPEEGDAGGCQDYPQ